VLLICWKTETNYFIDLVDCDILARIFEKFQLAILED